jgi:hypothetical protein
MVKAFLDTTVLTDALLKQGDDHKRAIFSFGRYDELLVPGYAIKEFKQGPLRYYVWLHNKVVTTNRWGDAVFSIPTVIRQHNLSMTAMRAVADFTNSMAVANVLAGELPANGARFHELQTREARIWLKTKISLAWRKRGKAPFVSTAPLDCYALTRPRETENGLIDNKPTKCTLGPCCLLQQFVAAADATAQLENVCQQSLKPEMLKRGKVLRAIRRHPHRELDENQCRTLGDAVFALQCPENAVVLTTNIADHQPLAAALGKQVEIP